MVFSIKRDCKNLSKVSLLPKLQSGVPSSLFQSKFSEFSREGNDNEKKEMIRVDKFKNNFDTGYVSSIKHAT